MVGHRSGLDSIEALSSRANDELGGFTNELNAIRQRRQPPLNSLTYRPDHLNQLNKSLHVYTDLYIHFLKTLYFTQSMASCKTADCHTNHVLLFTKLIFVLKSSFCFRSIIFYLPTYRMFAVFRECFLPKCLVQYHWFQTNYDALLKKLNRLSNLQTKVEELAHKYRTRKGDAEKLLTKVNLVLLRFWKKIVVLSDS